MTFTNERYIKTPQRKEKMNKLKKSVHVAEKTVQTIQENFERIALEEGEHVDAPFKKRI